MTNKAKAFIAANKISPVVSGRAIEQNPNKPSRGCRYTLKDGSRFTLSAAECAEVGCPRWDLPRENNHD